MELLLLVIKSKLKEGLIKYLNLINEKSMVFSNKVITDDAVNVLNSYAEISLQIVYNCNESEFEISPNTSYEFETALEKVDIGHAFQNKNIATDPKLKDFMLKLIELYFILLRMCPKKNLR